jgi:hypothetical protein
MYVQSSRATHVHHAAEKAASVHTLHCSVHLRVYFKQSAGIDLILLLLCCPLRCICLLLFACRTLWRHLLP